MEFRLFIFKKQLPTWNQIVSLNLLYTNEIHELKFAIFPFDIFLLFIRKNHSSEKISVANRFMVKEKSAENTLHNSMRDNHIMSIIFVGFALLFRMDLINVLVHFNYKCIFKCLFDIF